MPEEQKLYIPTGCKPLSESLAEQQIRLGIQGPPKYGKTFNALSFPNPVVLNLDKGLGAHVGKNNIIEVPMWYPPFVDGIVKRDGLNAPPNRKDAILVWLNKEGTKLSEQQTLIVDSSTQLQNAFVAQYNLNPKITKQGKIDDFGLWNQKVDYFGELCELFKALKCNVVYICHETADRSDDGSLNGGVRPLLTGQFGDQLASHFTDWFRAHAIAKPTTDENKKKLQEKFKLDNATLHEWLNSSTNEAIYLWQTQADEIAKCGTSTLVNAPKFVLANYSTFGKYKNKGK